MSCSKMRVNPGILNSTVWLDRDARDMLITAVLMSEIVPCEEREQLSVRSGKPTGLKIPAGKYGYVEAGGPAIARRAGLPTQVGLSALERLGAVEKETRRQSFGGRRLVRVEGGYLVLNGWKYCHKDPAASARVKRFTLRRKEQNAALRVNRKPAGPVIQANGKPFDPLAGID